MTTPAELSDEQTPIFDLDPFGRDHHGEGERLRAMMPWIAQNRLVDKAKN